MKQTSIYQQTRDYADVAEQRYGLGTPLARAANALVRAASNRESVPVPTDAGDFDDLLAIAVRRYAMRAEMTPTGQLASLADDCLDRALQAARIFGE